MIARWAPTPQILMGVLIGAFLIGRPWPLFHAMFPHAATNHDAAFGAFAFMLVAAGNMVLMALLFVPAAGRERLRGAGEKNPAGIRYASFRLADGMSFVRVGMVDGDSPGLGELTAFQQFQEAFGERAAGRPMPSEATLVGSYGFR